MGIDDEMETLRVCIEDFENSEMEMKAEELGKLGKKIKTMILLLKTRRTENNHVKVVEQIIEIINHLDRY